MADEPTLIDTNVLVYALYVDSPQNKAAQVVLTKALDSEAGFYVAPQSLFELFAVITNPRRVTAAFPPLEAVGVIEALLWRPGISVLAALPDIVPRCLELVRDGAVSGRQIFDALLVATMLGNGVHRIYTFNRADFASFSEIDVLTPSASD